MKKNVRITFINSSVGMYVVECVCDVCSWVFIKLLVSARFRAGFTGCCLGLNSLATGSAVQMFYRTGPFPVLRGIRGAVYG